jgi:hypothetical protein
MSATEHADALLRKINPDLAGLITPGSAVVLDQILDLVNLSPDQDRLARQLLESQTLIPDVMALAPDEMRTFLLSDEANPSAMRSSFFNPVGTAEMKRASLAALETLANPDADLDPETAVSVATAAALQALQASSDDDVHEVKPAEFGTFAFGGDEEL